MAWGRPLVWGSGSGSRGEGPGRLGRAGAEQVSLESEALSSPRWLGQSVHFALTGVSVACSPNHSNRSGGESVRSEPSSPVVVACLWASGDAW